jgi:eukaryotic translation initiation factor 2C
LECLAIVPSQRYNKRLNGDQTTDMIRATTQKPKDRQKSIREAVESTLRYDDNPYMKSFGFEVDKEMMTVPARILPAPKVVFEGGRSANGDQGQWNLSSYKLIDAPKLESYGFIFFVPIGQNEAIKIKDEIIRKWKVAGMNITTSQVPVTIASPHDFVPNTIGSALKETLDKLGKKCQLLICVIDKSNKDLYAQIKRATLLDHGVLSQCMLFKNVSAQIKDQYITNVALKVFYF